MYNSSFLLILIGIGIVRSHGIQAQCSSGWLRHGNSCYYVNNATNSWFDAAIFCLSRDSHLARIESKTENEFLKNIARSKNLGPMWVDLTDGGIEGTWRYSSNQELIQYFDWGKPEPNQGNSANCAGLWKSHDYQWDDNSCNHKRRSYCEKELTSNDVNVDEESECHRIKVLLDELYTCKKTCNHGRP